VIGGVGASLEVLGFCRQSNMPGQKSAAAGLESRRRKVMQ
jgi:hypothetical protein